MSEDLSDDAGFLVHDAANPWIWEDFQRLALGRMALGFQHYSARDLFSVLRWHREGPPDDGSGFKINNNWAAYYARKFHILHPEHAGFFRNRPSKADFEQVVAADAMA